MKKGDGSSEIRSGQDFSDGFVGSAGSLSSVGATNTDAINASNDAIADPIDTPISTAATQVGSPNPNATTPSKTSGASTTNASTGKNTSSTGSSHTPSKPAFTSRDTDAFTPSFANNFHVTASGSPTPSLTCAGSLPGGVMFQDNHNGTGTLSGDPVGASTTIVTFTAKNSEGIATQKFTLVVEGF